MNAPKILIVDDEPNIRLMLRMALESSGYQIQEAQNGQEALRVIEREVPDLVLLDLSMPVLDGMGVLKELHGQNAESRPRVVVLTAYGSIAVAVKATRLGAVDFLEKPIAPDELRSAVEAALVEPVEQAVREIEIPGGGYAATLNQVCDALRMARYSDAETLLMRVADLALDDPMYSNLLGVLYETQQNWKLARKFYGKALRIDKRYDPAQQNLQRLYELETLGHSTKLVVLGNEVEVRLADLIQRRK